jgi:hypothetical protein
MSGNVSTQLGGNTSTQPAPTSGLKLAEDRLVFEYLKDENGIRASLAIRPHLKETTTCHRLWLASR